VTDLLTAFGLVALAELGDKSQLLALAFASRHRWWQVLLGVAIAAAVLLGASAALGGALGAALPERAIALGGGVLFLGFAVWAVRDDEGDEDEGGAEDRGNDEGGVDHAVGGAAAGPRAGRAGRTGRSVVVTITVAFLVAELGDKTMLGTATLATTRDPVAVWLGATAGMTLGSGLAIVVGRLLHRRLPADRLRLVSAVAFALFGVLLLVEGIRG
jgi:Ca2+/H+ antiporter, TMEM165/GDT1 family